MDLRTQFSMVHRDLASPREYIDLRSKSHKSLPTKHKKRTSFFEDLQKQSKKIPGPGRYVTNPEDPKIYKKTVKKLNFEQLSKKPKESYIDSLLKSKSNVPGVGKYDMAVDKNEQVRKKYKIYGDRIHREAPLFRPTILDEVHVDNIKVDPGTYETAKPFGEKKSFRSEVHDIHQKKDESHKEGAKSKSMSLPKLPTPQTYHPLEEGTFQKFKSRDNVHSTLKISKEERFKKYDSLGPGPKYSLIAQWSPKSRDKPASNMFKSISTYRNAGIYH